MKKPTPRDVYLAISVFLLFTALALFWNKCTAEEYKGLFNEKYQPRFYTTMGFGFTNGDNIYCRGGRVLQTIGIVRFGYAISPGLRTQYNHHSCIAKEDDEGTLDSLELLFDFY